MPRPREYPDDLRQQLLDAAAHLLATEGPEALSTRRVSAAVGTSTTAIYRLLGSKQELVRALFLEGFRRLGDRLAELSPTDDPMADLEALGLAYHLNAVDNPELYDVMFACPVPGFVPSPDDAAYALTTLQVLIDGVARAIQAGLLAGSADEIALELWALNHGITSLALAGLLGSADQARDRLDHLAHATLAGLRVAGADAARA